MVFNGNNIEALENMTLDCEAIIVSEDYADIVIQYEGNMVDILEQYEGLCYQVIDEKYMIIHSEKELIIDQENIEAIDFSSQPTLLGPYGISSIDEAGILLFHTQPGLPLRGGDVIIGFVDSGIDYTHPAFVYENNTTKILSIWDQTINKGTPPLNFDFGTEFTEMNINEALSSDNPFDIVPSKDETGHGTFNAGIAAGRYVEAEQFAGAAPDADIIMVKLKPAKEYLRELYLIEEDAIIYQNNDIMLGVNYLIQQAVIYNKPLVICIPLGTNQGSHDGNAILEEFLERKSRVVGHCVVVAAGNEGNLAHHYKGVYPHGLPFQEVELNVAENEKGVNVELWSERPDVYSVSIVTPTGAAIPRLAPGLRTRQEFGLLLERTLIYIEYQLIEEKSGEQFIYIRLNEPTQGIWKIVVYGDVVIGGGYDIWIDREGWIKPTTQFLSPTIDTTLTIPSTAREPITVGAYNHLDNSLYIASGRGPTKDRRLKPELVAPGVNVIGPLPDNNYGVMTGTSVAASHVAGAAALVLEWGIVLGEVPSMSTRIIKNILTRGATRRPGFIYPNNDWGFGSLNLFRSFEVIRRR
ncbi:subtilase family protein [Natranaerovirga hydrolytica]|uniref:Subtilase family protein n=1 Tax=Natranaerovirga hydrolytica TaxID=680378 RepID=A0A4R1MYY0_9FIRM|nr:S8 family peptidase [Natranaerovirga hydrolytica]TCK98456.1 subtilase family protein [Natranaerovirga hydrolytica]